jgi:hypothetical protein
MGSGGRLCVRAWQHWERGGPHDSRDGRPGPCVENSEGVGHSRAAGDREPGLGQAAAAICPDLGHADGGDTAQAAYSGAPVQVPPLYVIVRAGQVVAKAVNE